MKIGVIGDLHMGMRSDSSLFHDLYSRFYQEVFFPEIRKRGITQIIQTGDTFDRRKFINFDSLNQSREYFFDEFTKGELKLTTYIGNHDCYYKNTLYPNSPTLLLSDYINKGQIRVISEPTTIFNSIDVIPWICEDNEASIKEFISKSKSQICFGHFELVGFQMESGIVCNAGMSREELSRYDMVISGHFHHKSSDGHIFYVGSPGEMTWADYDDPRGFHIFDTETRDLEFVANPFKMFHKVEYDETGETFDSLDGIDFSGYKDRYVKVIVEKKTNILLFDRFMDNFYKSNPAELSVVENIVDYHVQGDLEVNQAEQTHILLEKYVDSLEMTLDKEKMKGVMRKIYNEAHAIDNS